MIYISPKLYKDTLNPKSDLLFVKVKSLKSVLKTSNCTRSIWRPVKKILPFLYVKQYADFVDYDACFRKVD